MPHPTVTVYADPRLGRYNFGPDHPFGPKRLAAFRDEMQRQGLDQRVQHGAVATATQTELEYFHHHDYVELVRSHSHTGGGYLDFGDTPAFKGVYEAGADVVGSALDATAKLMGGQTRRAFLPIGGLHHARRDRAAGFCVFNDIGVVIEALRKDYGIRRIAYVDIDAHHGDGVCYEFIADPDLWVVDVHEQGIYPGTGLAQETGNGPAMGTKRNYPMGPGHKDDQAFMEIWPQAEAFVRQARPQIVLFQCGADSLAGDPITGMGFSARSHAHAATRLARLAEQHCEGRLLAFGGGGYDLINIGQAWTAVVRALVDTPATQADIGAQ